MEELIGEVKQIIFRNESDGFMICALDIDGNELTIQGYIPFINKGDKIHVTGNYVTHPKYGKQLKVQTFEKIMPQTQEAFEKYLGSGVIKGVGPSTAHKIVAKFKDKTIETLRSYPEKIAEIKGITISKAKEISDEFVEKWDLWQIVEFLKKFGISANSAQTVYKKLGANAVNEIQDDPYKLEEIGIKVDFKKIDKIALEIGIERTSLRRVGSGIIHALNLAANNGHSCVIKENLIEYTATLLGVSNEDVKDGLKDLESKEKIVSEKRKSVEAINGKTESRDVTWIYLERFYGAEKNIAQKLKSLAEAPNIKKIHNIDKMIKKVSDITPSKKQLEAINLINENNVAIITGGPGTGKTTIIKTIINMYKAIGKKTVLCAPTGRAAKRMTEATDEEAKTLHRLLQIGKLDDENPNPFLNVEPIDADVIVIDEMSMVDMFLMSIALNGIYKGTKLILVGDVNQLQSVGPGRILKDLIESGKIPYITLNKIFRQAAKSQIIVNAHKVNDGINFLEETDDKEDTIDDFKFIAENNINNVQQILLDNYDVNTQIITPSKKGDLGTKVLNELIQKKYNPEDESKREKKFGEIIFREGDKVMQTKNNYDIQWYKAEEGMFSKKEFGSGIFNGEMGIIDEINNEKGYIAIKFEDGKNAEYGYADLDQIEHCFAITVHKSQGSEFDKVVMPVLQIPPMLLARNVLYTGMTRAKKNLIMIGNADVVNCMINNVNSKKRNSGLQYKLEQIM